MMTEPSPELHTPVRSVSDRAAVHRALGDEHRLAIVDALWLSDRSFGELATTTGWPTNLLAFHLDVLEHAGVIERRRSEGDRRRRYLTLRPAVLPILEASVPPTGVDAGEVLFVCTANSARSQIAAALWSTRTGRPAMSAGTEPADRVHPGAIALARRHGLDLAGARPRHVSELTHVPALVVSVCDRAHEHGLTAGAQRVHWSVPDPVPHGRRAFEQAFADLDARVDRLARAA